MDYKIFDVPKYNFGYEAQYEIYIDGDIYVEFANFGDKEPTEEMIVEEISKRYDQIIANRDIKKQELEDKTIREQVLADLEPQIQASISAVKQAGKIIEKEPAEPVLEVIK